MLLCALPGTYITWELLSLSKIAHKVGMLCCSSSSSSWERRCLVVGCLSRDRGVAGSNLTGVTVLWP